MRSTRRLLFVAASSLALATGAFAHSSQAYAFSGNPPAAVQAAQTEPSHPWAQAASDIPADPAIRFGTLSNGMRYALMRNATPPGQASLRLRIDAGSLMETEQQLGLAHFAEHMVFNGTKKLPETEILRILERLGLAFGADSNAFTSFEQTAYVLELPNTQDETVDTSLDILRQMMSEALMEPATIDAERAVIEGEQRTRNTPQLRMLIAQLKLLAEGQLLPDRLPIGSLEVIRNAPAERFVEFYNAYYRPSRATLIAVGDFEVDAMEAKVRANFESWQPTAPDGPEPNLGTVAPREPKTAILVEAGFPSTIQINWIKEPDLSPDTLAKRYSLYHRTLGLAVLNRRLGEMARADNPPFLGAGANYQSLFDSLDTGTLAVRFNPGEWKRALETTEQEARRLAQFGVSDQELQREIVDMRTALQNAVAQAATRSTPALASGILSAANDNTVFSSPADDLAIFEKAVEGLTPERVNAAVTPVFSGQGPLVLFSSPVPVEGGEAAVTAALEASRQVAVTAPSAQAALEWSYDTFGTPAAPAQRTEVADLGLTLVRFPNGTLLNIKKTDFRDEQILVNARFGIGQLGMPKDRFDPLQAVNQTATAGGLGKYTMDELTRVLSGHVYSAALTQQSDAYSLSGATRPQDLQLQMQILAAYLTDPGLRPAPLQQFKALFPTLLEQIATTPAGVFARDGSGLLASGDRRETFPTLEEVANLTNDQVRAAVLPALANGPVEITVVGDLDIDAVISAVGTTFGALPARGPAPDAAPDANVRLFPAPTAEPVRLVHKGQAEQALGFIAWPTTDQVSDRTKARQLSILSEVLQLRVFEEVREKQALTYTPGVNSTTSDTFPGYGYMSVVAEVRPENLAKLYAAVDQIAADLVANPITEDELNRARRPAVERIRRSMADNGYWLTQLNEAQSDPASLDQTRSQLAVLEAVTIADIQRLAQEYLKPETAYRIEVVAESYTPAQ